MRKLVSLMVIAVLAVGVTFAQTDDAARAERPRTRLEQRQLPETVTINGTLKLDRGFVAVEDGEKTLLVPMLNRYIGFINGLQEGSAVSLEGYAGKNMLHLRKLTIDGKEYNFTPGRFTQSSAPVPRFNAPNRFVPQQRFFAPRNTPQRGFDRSRESAPGRGSERNRRVRPNR